MSEGVGKLVDWLLSVLDLLYFTRVLDAWESGVVLRLGRYHRTVGPGLHLIWPLGVERVVAMHTNWETSTLDVQNLTTAEGQAVAVRAIVTWRATSVRKLLLECDGHQQVMLDSATGQITEFVTGATWNDLTTEEFRRTLTTAVASRARKWGVKVTSVQLRDVTRCKALRVFSSSH